jgi:hypothetical protein
VLDRFRNNPEPKSADARGNQAHSRTTGLLSRLHVRVLAVLQTGKETNLIEQQQKGVLIGDPQAVYAGRGEWELIRSRLDAVAIAALAALSGVPVRTIRHYRQGDRRPRAATMEAIIEALVRMLNSPLDKGA